MVIVFIYRKQIEIPGIELKDIVLDSRLWQGLMLIPFIWVIIYSIFDRYRDIYRYSRFETLKTTFLLHF